eukprot:6481702-Amphidinium_carterae.1
MMQNHNQLWTCTKLVLPGLCTGRFSTSNAVPLVEGVKWLNEQHENLGCLWQSWRVRKETRLCWGLKETCAEQRDLLERSLLAKVGDRTRSIRELASR